MIFLNIITVELFPLVVTAMHVHLLNLLCLFYESFHSGFHVFAVELDRRSIFVTHHSDSQLRIQSDFRDA